MRAEGACGVSANEYIFAHGAQINFGDLTPYFTYAGDYSSFLPPWVLAVRFRNEFSLSYTSESSRFRATPITSLCTVGERSREDLHGLVEVRILEDLEPGNEDVEAGQVGDGLAEVSQLREIRELEGELKQFGDLALHRHEHVDVEQDLAGRGTNHDQVNDVACRITF